MRTELVGSCALPPSALRAGSARSSPVGRPRWGALIVLLCSACAAPNGSDDAGQEMTDAGDACVTMPSSLDFGEVGTGLNRTISVRLVNRARRAVMLGFTKIEAPFGSTANVLGMTIDPLGSQNVQFSFTAPDARLHFTQFTFTGGEGCTPQEVTLSGLGAGGLEAVPLLEFPPIESGTTTTAQLLIFNTRREATRVFLNVGQSADGLVHFTTPEFVDIAAASALEVPITFVASGDGLVVAQLILGSDHRDRFDVVLQGSSGVPIIEVNRRRIESNPLGLLLPAERSVALRNAGRGELLIHRVSVTSNQPGAASEVAVFTAERLRPNLISFARIEISPHTTGHREWTLQFETNDPVTPSLAVELVAEVRDLPRCQAMISAPIEVTVSPPYPREAEIAFENTTAGECFVESLAFTSFTEWTHDLGAQDSFVVPAGSTVRRVVSVTGPGSSSLVYFTHSSGLLGRTIINALP